MNIIHNIEEDNSHSVFVTIDNFLTRSEIDFYRDKVNSVADWKTANFFGNTPRLQKWYQDDNKYFSNHWFNQNHERWMSNKSEDWLIEIRNKVQEKVNHVFNTEINEKFNGCHHPKINSSLINYYRDGNDYIKYHKDDEKVFGNNPTVVMLTFGSERDLKFKRNNYNTNYKYDNFTNDHELNKSITIKEGSLFMMMGGVQKYYWHGVERNTEIKTPRYSLTFREHKT
jgi:alkylated DNA repair dioxygenase AlkB